MSLAKALFSGLVGAGVLTAINLGARKRLPGAPRLETLGMRAIGRPYTAITGKTLDHQTLRTTGLVGDLLTNTLYFSLAAAGEPRDTLRRGAALGMLAGVASAVLPRYVGLGRQPGQRTPYTQIMTAAWYTAGAMAAAGTYAALQNHE